MNAQTIGKLIGELRKRCGMTQAALAERVGVSNKAVSKWETGKGLPDLSLIQPLAQALGVSVIELMSGEPVANRNVSANLLRSKFYVCPICGNVIHCCGETVVSCCGVTLPPLEAEEPDAAHAMALERVEDEWYVTLDHPMDKDHFITFLAWVGYDRVQILKMYPQQDAAARIALRGGGKLYACCNRHGLFEIKVPRK